MTRFRVLVVDDEPLAREAIRGLLERDDEIASVTECGDGEAALLQLRNQRPDIAFLDIEMPERGGLEVAAELTPEEMPAIVFVTAFDDYATRAFEVRALDYVLKPFSDRRFFDALERAKQRVREQRLSELAERIATLSGELSGPGSIREDDELKYLRKIPVKSRERTLLVDAAEIDWIESEDYYVRLHTSSGNHLLRASLSSLEQQLDPRRFLRVHRSAIVNLERVRELRPLFKGACVLRLSDGSSLRVSRSRRRQVEKTLMPRLGSA